VSAARNNHIRVALARLDEFIVHRLNCREVLFEDLVERPSAHVYIPLDAADEPDVRVRVDEDFHVTQIADPGVDEEENAVDDHDVRRLYVCALGATQVGDEIVLCCDDAILVDVDEEGRRATSEAGFMTLTLNGNDIL
jgi:hypothetical protein